MALPDERGDRLARALHSHGVGPGDLVLVIVCDPAERAVALEGVAKAGARPLHLPCDMAPDAFAAAHRRAHPTATIACAEGVELWHAAGCHGRILGDGPGVTWWRLAELRESAAARARMAMA
jgi:non-ribosomal peptide synthetase component F